MNGLLEKIYRGVIHYEKDAVQMEKELAEEVDELLVQYADRLSEEQMACRL